MPHSPDYSIGGTRRQPRAVSSPRHDPLPPGVWKAAGAPAALRRKVWRAARPPRMLFSIAAAA